MLDYVDYVVRAFEQQTNWYSNNSYENITATSRSLLNFAIPQSIKFQTSNKSTDYTYSTLELTRGKKINGSLAYLYTDIEGLDKILRNSDTIALQDAIETYRYIQPSFTMGNQKCLTNTESFSSESIVSNSVDTTDNKFKPRSLYFGRLYYPSSVLEAMMIKRLSPYTQMTIKCISSTTRGSNLNFWTFYWQRYKRHNCQEWIFSSNDGLCGYRILHNVMTSPSKFNSSLYNNSSLAVGAELWLSLGSLNPGLSTSLRYCTHSAYTGRPLTLTFTWNPLFGHVSSTYSAKTTANSTFTTKYDFNLYSTEANLSFGCEFWRSDTTTSLPSTPVNMNIPSNIEKTKVKTGSQLELSDSNETDQEISPSNNKTSTESSIMLQDKNLMNYSSTQQQYIMDLTHTFESSLIQLDKERSIIEDFENKFNNKKYSSVWKLSTSLMDKNLKILWEGKFKGFLLSAGTELLFNIQDKRIQPIINPATQFGIKIQYST